MHELSIALSLVELAAETAAREGACRVTRLCLRIGLLSGVVREALAFSFGLAAEGTPCAGAALEIEEVPVTVHCHHCGADRVPAETPLFRCPGCGAPAAEVVTGRELDLVSIEVEDEPADPGSPQ